MDSGSDAPASPPRRAIAWGEHRARELDGLLDVPALQELLDLLQALEGVTLAVVDLDGNVLASTGFQEVCAAFHRAHAGSLEACVDSDVHLLGAAPGGSALCRCRNGLWDLASPVIVEGRHVAQAFLGQFLLEGEEVDRERFVAQAERHGYDREAYLAAVARVPRLSRQRAHDLAALVAGLARHVLRPGPASPPLLDGERARSRPAVEALRRSEDSLKQAQRIAHLGNWDLDLVKNVLTWSDEIFRIFEIDATRFGASYEAFVQLVHPEDREAVNRAYTESVANRTPYEIVHRLRLPDGRVKYVREQCETFYDAAGRPLRSVGTVQDITERTLAEERLRRGQRLEAVGALAGGVAHDFNNLLTAILGSSATLLERLPESDPVREEAADIQLAARRAAALTRQLLTFSRKQPVQPKVLELDEVVAGMDRLLRRIIGEDVQLVTHLGEGVPRVRMDPGQLEQVIVNLVVNARDAMPGGGRLTLETAALELDEDYTRQHPGLRPGRWVMVAVSDTGRGMSPEVQAHLFEPFFTTKEVGQGTGLGLSTVYGIVKQAGGEIVAYSELEKGTVFKVFLPPTAERPGAEPALRGDVRPLVGASELVLVVEDETLVRALMVKRLRRAGYRVLEAGDGEEALAVLAEAGEPHVDAVITDMVMPRMGGEVLAGRLRQARPTLRVLFVSGYTAHSQAFEALPSGTAFLQKPFTPDDLGRALRALLEAPRAP